MAKKKTTKKRTKKTTKPRTKKSVKKTSSKTKKQEGYEVTETLAIVSLILNILVLPGLGTLIGKKTTAGIWQLVLFILGIPLSLVIIGIPMIAAAWIWGIVSGIQLIKEAQ